MDAISAAAPAGSTPSGHRLERLPDGTARVHFASAILEHADQPRRHVDFRPYTISERLEIGDPVEALPAATSGAWHDATGIRIIDRPRLMLWYRRLMVGHDPDMLGRVHDGALAELVEEAILGFFMSARTRSKPASAPSPATAPASPTSDD